MRTSGEPERRPSCRPATCRATRASSTSGTRRRRCCASVRAGDAQALALVRELHPRPPAPEAFRLADAQLVVARRYGFPSWPKLHAPPRDARALRALAAQGRRRRDRDREERVDEFLRLACLTYGADDPARWERARAMLDAHPELARATAFHDRPRAGRRRGGARSAGARPGRRAARGRPARLGAAALPRLLARHRPRRDTRRSRSRASCSRRGADPNAGFLWEGLSSPFTALTGAFGRGEDASSRRTADELRSGAPAARGRRRPERRAGALQPHWTRTTPTSSCSSPYGLGRATAARGTRGSRPRTRRPPRCSRTSSCSRSATTCRNGSSC